MSLDKVALNVPQILLPRQGVDLTRWAVVACDQFTSQPEYWKQVDELVGSSPSALRLIYPEVYLNSTDQDRYISTISKVMDDYLAQGILVPQKRGFILVERMTSMGVIRRGLIVCLDLEHYDFRQGSTGLIRATEGTVLERLPVRVRIREKAAIESPHIMVLIDDPEMTVIEPLFAKRHQKVYDFELMMNGGHIMGLLVEDKDEIRQAVQGLMRLADVGRFKDCYGVRDSDVLLYAVGDGNHSLAAARLFWEQLKDQAQDKAGIMNHPGRYALVELMNVHDKGLDFEPIHRVLFNVKKDDVFTAMTDFFVPKNSDVSVINKDDLGMVSRKNTHIIEYVSQGANGFVLISNPRWNLEVGSLQAFLDAYMIDHPEAEIDYIHGDSVLKELASRPSALGFLLPVLPKHDLFKTIVLEGALPRKAFSMGQAEEKRYYVECRKIRP